MTQAREMFDRASIIARVGAPWQLISEDSNIDTLDSNTTVKTIIRTYTKNGIRDIIIMRTDVLTFTTNIGLATVQTNLTSSMVVV